MEETQRQKKIAEMLKRELTQIIQREMFKGGTRNIVISITKMYVTQDLSAAKAYFSIFPRDKTEEVLDSIKNIHGHLKNLLAQETRHQMRRMPELIFYHDDSLEYEEGIEKAVKSKEDPIKDPGLLDDRKKR
jgi:ribosome-binding factor A